MASSCEHVGDVGAYHDGALCAEEAHRVEEHMRRCPACALELERLRGLSRLLAATAAPAISSAAMERLHRGVRAAREGVIVRMAGALTAAAAAVLVVCSLWLWQTSRTPDLYGQTALAWEDAAMGGTVDVAAVTDPEEQLAQWIVEDLSRENGHD